MIVPSVRVVGAKHLTKTLRVIAARSGPAMEQKVAHWGHILESRIKGRAPVRTGDYRRSWNTQVRGATAVVGTNKPQARRLEYGFVGTDSLGRHYNQAPRLHVRPSIDEVRGPYLRDIAKVAKP